MVIIVHHMAINIAEKTIYIIWKLKIYFKSMKIIILRHLEKIINYYRQIEIQEDTKIRSQI